MDDKHDRVDAALVPTGFAVGAGAGCYLGHVTIAVRDGAVLDYELDRAGDEAAVERLPEALRARVREHVDGPCPVPSG